MAFTPVEFGDNFSTSFGGNEVVFFTQDQPSDLGLLENLVDFLSSLIIGPATEQNLLAGTRRLDFSTVDPRTGLPVQVDITDLNGRITRTRNQ